MIEFNEANIQKLIFHKISNEHKYILNNHEYKYESEDEETILKKIFLKPFQKCDTTYEFAHTIDIDLHPLFKLTKSIFNHQDFVSTTHQIHQYLKSVSKHPNIKDGDLFIIKYNDVKFNNQLYNAIGIYKIENKDNFIETHSNNNQKMKLELKQGISGRKMDKACLILLTEEPYTVFVIDNGSTETDYWMNEFLCLENKNDYINSTNQFLTFTKSYITEQLPEDFEINRTEQIELLNRSVQYFKVNDTYQKENFENEVLVDKKIIESFRKYDDIYQQENEFEQKTTFQISDLAVKKQAKYFKSILKLDKNFHVYIHGNSEMIEHGIDDDGRKFYKLYYQEEN